MEKQIVILLGWGKSTLLDNLIDHEDACSFTDLRVMNTLYNISKYKYAINYIIPTKKNEVDILKRIISGKKIEMQRQYRPSITEKITTKFIFQLCIDEKDIPKWIKKYALIYKLDIIK
jgi:hypothetical protein